VESDGRRVSAVAAGIDRSQTHYFQNTMALQPGDTYVSSFTQETGLSSEGRPFLHYTLRLPDGEGIVLIDLHAGWLLRNLPADPGQDSWVILDQDGTFLVYPEQFDPSQSGVDVQPMLEGSAGSIETGESVFVYDSVHPSEATPDFFWVIFRQTPKSLLYADVTSFYAITSAVILGATLLALALALVASGRILKPLLNLERQTAAFGLGGPAPALPIHISRDEIGTLTRTFVQMAKELEHQRQQEHRLIEKLIDAQEEERKLVAYDLHDGLIQQLVGARYYLNNVYENCTSSSQGGCDDIKRGCDTLTEAIVEGRRIVEGLRPAVLDDLGLTVAIEEVAQTSAQAAGWTLDLDVESIPIEPDKAVGVTVFRIAQEALNNIRKHADARHVRLTMRNGTGIDLLIQDDGIGFDPNELNGDTRGLGVTTMKERATLIHGSCEISSLPGGGTQVHVWVPLSPQSAVTTRPDSA
jgi:signal transduction histidine kinase